MNPLNIKTKKETGYAVAILHSSRFRKARAKTLAGKRLYNREIETVKRKAKQFGITLHKKLPNKFKI